MSRQRNQSVKKSAKGAIINMNPKVILEKMRDPKVQSLQRIPLIKNVKLELLDFEENFECPFCDYESFSSMEFLSKHVKDFHKISKTKKKSEDVAMILTLLNISVTSLDSLNPNPELEPLNLDLTSSESMNLDQTPDLSGKRFFMTQVPNLNKLGV